MPISPSRKMAVHQAVMSELMEDIARRNAARRPLRPETGLPSMYSEPDVMQIERMGGDPENEMAQYNLMRGEPMELEGESVVRSSGRGKEKTTNCPNCGYPVPCECDHG